MTKEKRNYNLLSDILETIIKKRNYTRRSFDKITKLEEEVEDYETIIGKLYILNKIYSIINNFETSLPLMLNKEVSKQIILLEKSKNLLFNNIKTKIDGMLYYDNGEYHFNEDRPNIEAIDFDFIMKRENDRLAESLDNSFKSEIDQITKPLNDNYGFKDINEETTEKINIRKGTIESKTYDERYIEFKNKLIALIEEKEKLEMYVKIYARIRELLVSFDTPDIDTLRRKSLLDLENLKSLVNHLQNSINRKERILNHNIVSDNYFDHEKTPSSEEKYETYKEIRDLFDRNEIDKLKEYDLGDTYEEIINSIKGLRFDLIETNLIYDLYDEIRSEYVDKEKMNNISKNGLTNLENIFINRLAYMFNDEEISPSLKEEINYYLKKAKEFISIYNKNNMSAEKAKELKSKILINTCMVEADEIEKKFAK